MNSSFDSFINSVFPDLNQLYPYQKEIIKNIQSSSKPFNIHEIMLKQRQYNRRFEHMLRLYHNLLHNKSVLDLFLALYFKFELNSDNELELVIDEYDQSNNSHISMGSVGIRATNIFACEMDAYYNHKKQSYKEKLEEALEVIKRI